MSVIRHAQSRRTETPNAVMTTFASPTQGGAGLAMWRVDMRAGQSGPVHAFDVEQVWTCLSGGATVELGEESFVIGAGDTIVMPADVRRQVHADQESGLTAIVAAQPGGRAYSPDGTLEPAGDACAVRDGDRLIPAWTA
ncbi:cupin domain-containing protein [Sphaerisporangium fuscum]|uniref:cupin domain-containing protein n=1 Tax=Sphaerisporangium fuscum TaxID=2835868 RepID=UPI001BDC237C|nr:cupin domain-containing protein [Sphaerisporangium fuscum]